MLLNQDTNWNHLHLDPFLELVVMGGFEPPFTSRPPAYQAGALTRLSYMTILQTSTIKNGRTRGVEPPRQDSQSCVLPLNYTRHLKTERPSWVSPGRPYLDNSEHHIQAKVKQPSLLGGSSIICSGMLMYMLSLLCLVKSRRSGLVLSFPTVCRKPCSASTGFSINSLLGI